MESEAVMNETIMVLFAMKYGMACHGMAWHGKGKRIAITNNM